MTSRRRARTRARAVDHWARTLVLEHLHHARMSPRQLSGLLGLSLNDLANHLWVLERAGLIRRSLPPGALERTVELVPAPDASDGSPRYPHVAGELPDPARPSPS